MNCLLVLSLAVLGASAAPCGFNVAPGCAPALPGRTIVAQTPVVENPTAVFPTILPTSSVSEACHCLKTTVRPQIRNEIITVPSVDRVVRVVTSPVVEAVSVNTGGNTRNYQVPTCGGVEGVSGVVGGVSGVVGGVSGVVSSPVITGVQGVVSSPVFSGVQGVVAPVQGVVSSPVFSGSYGIGGVVGTGCGSSVIA